MLCTVTFYVVGLGFLEEISGFETIPQSWMQVWNYWVLTSDEEASLRQCAATASLQDACPGQSLTSKCLEEQDLPHRVAGARN
jgi:hypothetical protein